MFPTILLMEDFGTAGSEATAGPPLSSAGSPSNGGRLGDYRLLREIGRGGMGVVYEAEQVSLGRRVALKILPRETSADARRLQRFQREARAAAPLHHTEHRPRPRGGRAGWGLDYYVMRFIPGLGLDAVLTELEAHGGPSRVGAGSGSRWASSSSDFDLPTDGGSSLSDPTTRYHRSVALIGVQVAEALAHAHDAGVLHRDVKPSNLLLDLTATLWVTDFGLAKAEGAEDLTPSGDVVGTLRYMGPERFKGCCDQRSDVYGLGATLYQLLTLRPPPFLAPDRAAMVHAILHDSPIPLRKVDPRIPRDLEAIVLKALAREPALRYRDAAEVAGDLRRFLNGRPVVARRSSLAERAWLWGRRNPAVAALTGMVAALLVVVAVGSSPGGLAPARDGGVPRRGAEQRHPPPRRVLRGARPRAPPRGEPPREPGGPRGRSLTADPRRPRAGGSAERSRRRPLAHRPAPRREWESTPGPGPFAIDETFRRYARREAGGRVAVREVESHAEVATVASEIEGPAFFALSPGGRHLGHRLGPRAELGPQRRERLGRTAAALVFHDAEFSRDGRLFAAGCQDGTTWLFDLEGRRICATRPPRAGSPGCASRPAGAWWRGGLPAAATSWSSTSTMARCSGPCPTGRRSSPWPGTVRPADRHGLSGHDGARLGRRQRRGSDGRAHGAHERGGVGPVPSRERSPGDGILDGTLRLWDLGSGLTLAQHPGMPLGFGPGGRLAVQFHSTAGVLEIEGGGEHRVLALPRSVEDPIGIAISPDGRLLASAGEGGVRPGTWTRGTSLARLPLGPSHSAVFHPAGQRPGDDGR